MTDRDRISARAVGELAATLPGAAALFRDAGVGFCCHGDASLAEKAARKRLDAGALAEVLVALEAAAGVEAPDTVKAIIEHIVSRYHDTHRRQFAELIPLAHKVERVHGDHAAAPAGLADLLTGMRDALEMHMMKEEMRVFPLMTQARDPMLAAMIAQMRDEHDDNAAQFTALEHITHGHRPPEGACRSWTALCDGTRALSDDLVAHMNLENAILFPRFETTRA